MEQSIWTLSRGAGRGSRPRGTTHGSLEDLPAEVRAAITVHPVSELGEVLALALRGGRFQEGRLLFGDQGIDDVAPLASPRPQ